MDRKIEISLKDIYQNNDRFRRYVDKQAGNYRLTVDEVLSRALTREVVKLYMRKVRPILFNTEMVRAILDGRKTVTRRVLRPRYQGNTCRAGINQPCNPGDILYVRETWAFATCINCNGDYAKKGARKPCHDFQAVEYDDGDSISDGCFLYKADCEKPERITWRPSIHMPKQAARIWLKVTDVRVEQLQDITDAEAKREGAQPQNPFVYDVIKWPNKENFKDIWDSTIKKADISQYGWAANPWVWVIEFRRCPKPGHGQAEQADACDICGAIRQGGEEKENSRR